MFGMFYQFPCKATHNIRHVVCQIDVTQGEREYFSISLFTRKQLLCYNLTSENIGSTKKTRKESNNVVLVQHKKIFTSVIPQTINYCVS